MVTFAGMGWVYWLVVSQISSTSEVGQASKIISLVFLISVLIQLGLEYPLLKKSSKSKNNILGTMLVFEISVTLASIPILFYVINFIYQETAEEFSLLAIGFLLANQVYWLSRYALLGISEVKDILIIDLVGLGIRILTVLILVSTGFQTLGILGSFFIQYLVVGLSIVVIAKKKKFGLRPGSVQFTKELVKDGLINAPSKYSRLIVFSLSVVLLASFGLDDSEVGIFYIALMISMIGGGIASSMAFMSIPASSITQVDLSSSSLRIGFGISAPIIAVLMVAPRSILTLIGQEYASGELVLFVLAMAILPFIVIINAVTKFNNLNKTKELIVMGSVQLSIFLAAFWLLVPQYQSLGASLAILISFVPTVILALIWSERKFAKFVSITVVAVGVSWAIGYSLMSILHVNEIAVIIITLSIAFIMILTLKLTSAAELGELIKNITKKGR